MFPMGFVLLVLATLLCSAAASISVLAGIGTLALAWVIGFVILFGALLVIDGRGRVRVAGTALLAAAVLGLGFAFGMHPALADVTPAIAAPPGDTGFWSGLNGYLAEGVATIVAALAGWALKEAATHTRLKIRTDQEEQIRETMKTGAFAAMSELELQVDQHWTPEQRQAVLDKVVAWAQERAAAQLKKLGLPAFVVNAMASKVIGGVLAAFPFLNVGTGTSLISDGNPGTTPALDRAAGGNGGN